jgi:phage terminase large subunit-like protein
MPAGTRELSVTLRKNHIAPNGMDKAVASPRDRLKALKNLERKKMALMKFANEKKHRERHQAINYYTPHKKQAEFHSDKSRIRIVLGGNRSGKSTAGACEQVAHALGYRPWLSKDNPDYKINIRVPNKGLIIGESFGEQVKKVLVPKLLGDIENGMPGFLPSDVFESAKKNPQGIVTHIRLKSGGTIDFQSYDQDIDLFESSDYDWISYDEPPPRPIWIATQRGLTDRMGPCWIAMTPLKEAYIHDEIVSRVDVGKHFFDIEDNLNFGLTRDGIDEFALNLTEDEKESRLRGRFFHLSGLVYKLYGNINRIKRVPIRREWGVWFHADTHPRTPHHAVWVAILPDGKLYVCGELKNHDPSNLVRPFAEAIKEYEATVLKRRGDEIVRLIEPGASTPNPTKDGLSIDDEFREHGIACRPGSKNRDAGILRMQNELQYDPAIGTYPNIYFYDDLIGIHHEMTHYVWDDWAQKAAYGRTDKQKPKDKDDHYIEGIHRVLLDSPECRGYYQEEPYRETYQAKTTANSITGY